MLGAEGKVGGKASAGGRESRGAWCGRLEGHPGWRGPGFGGKIVNVWDSSKNGAEEEVGMGMGGHPH